MKAVLAKASSSFPSPAWKNHYAAAYETGRKGTNIEITDANIKSFDPIAKKNGLDYTSSG